MGIWRSLYARAARKEARSNRKRRSGGKPRVPRGLALEPLEERALLAIGSGPLLDEIVTNGGTVLVDGETRHVAPRELVFRFDLGERIDPLTLGGIQITRAGGDQDFSNNNEVPVDPLRAGVAGVPRGFVGVGDQPHEVVMRFADPLPNDRYRLTIFGSGPTPLMSKTGEAFNNKIDVSIDFNLDVGAQVVGVVPQPISRLNPSDPFSALTQANNQIVLYFNSNDPLEESSAQNPDFYQLIFTNNTATNSDDLVFRPNSVSYDPQTGRAVLTFSSDLHQLPGINLSTLPGGVATFRLRAGDADTPPWMLAPSPPLAISPSVDPGSSFGTAFALPQLTSRTQVISAAIEPQLYRLAFPGGINEPGHRDIPPESHLGALADRTSGITTIFYDFRKDYGVSPTGFPLENIITEAQKQRVREVLELYAHYLGVQFIETNPEPGTPSLGLTIATGDMLAVDPNIATGPGGIVATSGPPNRPQTGAPVNSQLLSVIDAAEDWGVSEFGGGYFQEVMRQVGVLLGFGRATDLPDRTLNVAVLPTLFGNTGEPVFPGDHDIVHGQHLYRPESNDIDLYRFEVQTHGVFSAETVAERLTASSLLDTVVTLFGDVRSLRIGSTTAGKAAVLDGDTFVLEDGVGTPVTFEFDRDGSVALGNRRIAVGADDTPAQVAAATAKAIRNVAGLGVDPVAAFDRVKLRGASAASLSAGTRLSLSTSREVLARNDDYYSEDSLLELRLSPGTYYVGVTSKGNVHYDPTIEDSGFGGTTQGRYDLRLNFKPDATSGIRDQDSSGGTLLDGDGDGVPGGVFNFWFQVADASNTIYVDKAAAGGLGQLGSISNPYRTIADAFAAAGNSPTNDIVRIVGNAGADGDFATLADNLAYSIGWDGGQPLEDGPTMEIPQGVTVMVDAGAVFKVRAANIEAGSSAQGIDRSEGHLQVLGIPGRNVHFTSARDTTIGTSVSGEPDGPKAGDWGGLVFRNDLDRVEQPAREVLEHQGIFLNYVNQAVLRFGGGEVTVNSVTERYNPIHMVEARPTITFNTITRSADAALSADPNSFIDTRFRGADFTADYDRVGPEIHGNRLALYNADGTVSSNSINGLFVRIRTQLGNPVDVLQVAARWDDVDIPHVLTENLIIRGTPGGGLPLVGTVVTGSSALAEATGTNPTNDTLGTAVATGLAPTGPSTYRVFQDTGFLGDNPTLTNRGLDVDFYSFQLDAGSRVSIDLDAVFSGFDPLLDGNLRLFDSNGVELASSRDALAPSEAFFFGLGRRGEAFIDFVAPRAGTYYVAVAAGGNVAYNPAVPGSGTPGNYPTGRYRIEIAASTSAAQLDARLAIDAGVVVKLQGARIETQIGAQLIAEGRLGEPVVFTSLRDDRFGGSGTFDTNGDRALAAPAPGDWGGLYFGHVSQGSLDHALVTFGGGTTRIEGTFDRFNAIEIHQADVRITNSVLQENAGGQSATTRGGRAANVASVIFVRGAQPVLVNNVLQNNAGPAISINANAMQARTIPDIGRTTGRLDAFEQFADNQGPLVRLNRLGNNATNGLVVRGATLTTESVWDDTDIVHVLRDEIVVTNHHVYSGMRLQSSAEASLVVKLKGATAGFTATGRPLDIPDRIGGSVQVVGTFQHPVILTSLGDCSVGAGLTPDGMFTQTDTENTGLCSPGGPITIGNSGAVVIDGGDRDDLGHGNALPGPDGTLGTADDINQAGWLFIEQMLRFALAGARNGAADEILVIGARSIGNFNLGALPAVQSAARVLNVPITVVTGAALQSVNFNQYKVIYVPSHERDTFGGITDADSLILTQRKAEIQQFVNNGGSLVALTQQSASTPYSWLELPLPFTINAFGSGGIIFPLRKTPAAIAAGFTISDQELSLGTPYHNAFTGPPGFNSLVPFVLDTGFDGVPGNADDHIITLGLASGSAGIGTSNPASPGDWRSIRLEQYSNDRNVEAFQETESAFTNGVEANNTPSRAQFLGELAPDEKSGDDNRRLGFHVHGAIAHDHPADVDVYSFRARAGTEVWLDIDRTSQSLDTIVELVDANGVLRARSINSLVEQQTGQMPPLPSGTNFGRIMQRDVFNGRDLYTTNPRDAGLRVVLPGAPGTTNTYFVRVRSNPAPGNLENLSGGQTRGTYQLQIRLRELDEVPGSTVRSSDIRFASNAIEILGLPAHSPLVGDASESPNDTGNEGLGGARDIGNMLVSDRGTLSVSGALATPTDVDWYRFTVDYDLILPQPGDRTFPAIFDIDWADGLARPDTIISVFDSAGRLVLVGRDSDVADDQLGPTPATGASDLSRGTFGKLDPYIGSVQLPAGEVQTGTSKTYYVAVHSNATLPTALNYTFQNAASAALTKLEPINSIQRIAEDHIGFSGYTSGLATGVRTQINPEAGPLLDISTAVRLQTHVKPFTLADVNLYVTNGSTIVTIDAVSGRVETTFPGFGVGNNFVEDLQFRSDGQLFGYQSMVNTANTAGRLVQIDPGTGALTTLGQDNIQDATLNTNLVDALAIRRTGTAGNAPTYNEIFYSVRDGFFTSRLFRANAAGDANAQNFGPVGPIQVLAPGDIGVTTGMAFGSGILSGTLFGVSDQGHFYTISTANGLATVLATFPGMSFSGLTIGPQNLDFNQDGVFGDLRNTFFAITNNGTMMAIQVDDSSFVPTTATAIPVFDANGDGVLETTLQTDAFFATGLGFSPVDFNLWHPTMLRRSDPGHGINPTFDNSRVDPQNMLRTVGSTSDLRTTNEGEGGLSFYFGLEQWVTNPASANRYLTYSYPTAGPFGGGSSNAQYGVISTNAHLDLASAPNVGDNYNVPGGAHGSLITNSFSLEGYAATDKPTLYFNYHLRTQNADNSGTINGMRDSARVFISADGGVTWSLLATNNSHRDLVGRSELPRFASASYNVDSTLTRDPRQRVQELFDTTTGANDWRQARIDLGEFAGQNNLVLRFDFSTAGSMNEPGLPGDEFGSFSNRERGQANNFEGFYVDDILIGFAERGEMVTGAPADQPGFSPVPINPNPSAPAQVLTGAYQLEMRRGQEYGVNIFRNASPIVLLPGEIRDTNDRLVQGFTIAAPAPEVFTQTITQANNVFFPNVLSFNFANLPQPNGPATLVVEAVADLDTSTEFLRLQAESLFTQDLFVNGGLMNQPVTTTVNLTQAQVQALLANDGAAVFTIRPSSEVGNFTPNRLRLTLTYPTGTVSPDGDTFTISDGSNTITFEFDSVGGVQQGNRPVSFLPTDTAAAVAQKMVAAINAAGFGVSAQATPSSNLVNLFNAASVTTAARLDLRVVADSQSVRENGTGTQARVFRDGPTTSAVTVLVTALDAVTGLPTDEVNLNGSGGPTALVTIPAGSNQSAPFSIVARDDNLVDGTQAVVLVASFNNFNGVSTTIDVLDDEAPSLTIGPLGVISESSGPGAITGTVSLSAPADRDTVINLLSSDPTEATVTSSVTILQGQTSATFSVDAVFDFFLDGPQTITIWAYAPGFISGGNTLVVTDSGITSPLLPFVGQNVNISRAPNSQAEAAISINHTNPNNLFALSNEELGDGMFGAVSTDGGRTWTRRQIAGGIDGLPIACCDPSVAFDQFGNLFMTYLGRVSDGRHIIVALSTDGGQSFTQIADLDLLADQPTVTTGAGSVWVTWNRAGRIFASGALVSGLGLVGSFVAPQMAPGPIGVNFGDIAIGPNGEVLVTYQDNLGSEGPSILYVNIDLDGVGSTTGFSQAIAVTSTNVGGFDFLPAQPNRSVDAAADLAWDRSGGPFNGRVYLVYTDELPQESNNFDIFLRYSDDSGNTWSSPIKVNDDNTTRSQFLPRIAVDQSTGHLAISWHDARNDDGQRGPGDTNGIPNDDTQFYGTFSTNGGQSFFPNFRISAGTSNAAISGNRVEYGDYTGLDFVNNRFYPIWADNSGALGQNPDLPTFDLLTAQVALSPTLGTVRVEVANPVIQEGATPGPNSATAKVVVSTPPAQPLTVFLTVTSGNEATGIPLSVVIPAGVTESQPFTITAVDDLLANGGIPVIISPAAVGYDGVPGALVVQDNDVPELDLRIVPPAVTTNGAGSAVLTGVVSRNTPTDKPLVVWLTSSDLSEARVPRSVTIPAGSTSVAFAIDAAYEFGFDPTRTVTITASTPGFTTDRETLTVDGVEPFGVYDREGDKNIVREQGQVIIRRNRISNSSGFGIVVDAGPRDGNNNRPHPGVVRNLRELNTARLVPGVVVENNLLVENGQGGIRFSGDPNGAGLPLAAVPFGRIINNTIYGGQTPRGVGIEVTENASPTILNNVVANLVTGVLIDASSSSTVLAATVFKGNTTHVNTGAIGQGNAALDLDVLSPNFPLFRNVGRGDFNLIEGSLAIDSSVDSLSDRLGMVTVTAPLGIPQSPILAPERDMLGRFRVDNPLVAAPPGLGLNVFKDRGALERIEPVTMTINDVRVVEEGNDARFAVFEVRLSEMLAIPLTVVYSTSPGTATPNLDYQPTSGTLTFQPGTVVMPISVPILGDPIDEFDETFFVNLSNVSAGAQLIDNQGQGTIVDNDPPPVLNIDDVTITPEGNTGTKQAVFTVSLSIESGKPIVVGYATAPGTTNAASAGLDYTSTSGTLTFAPGTLTRTITVDVLGDVLEEPDETFFVNLTNINPLHVTFNKSQGVGTIVDDDPLVSIDDVTVVEGNGPVQAVFTVTLNKVGSVPLTVNYSTASGTALAGFDFTATNGVLTFAPGETSKTVTVDVLADNLDEDDERFFVNLTGVIGGTLGKAVGQGTIVDDPNDLPPQISITDVVVNPEGDTGSTTAAGFNVTLSAPSGRVVTVVFATANGTGPTGATAGSDYVQATGTLVFVPSIVSQVVLVDVLGDTVAEPDERFHVDLSLPVNATISRARGTATIIDDEPRVTIGNASVIEGDTNDRTMVFTVSLTRVSSVPVTVTYSTADGSAAAPGDYTAVTNGTLTFNPGQTLRPISITVKGDLLDEDDETFFVNLTSAVGAMVTGGVGQGTILDNDGLPSLSINSPFRQEGDSGEADLVFTVTLSVPSGREVSVAYTTVDGTALASRQIFEPGDYVATSGTLTFSPGQTVQQVTVRVQGDTLDEPNEVFFVDLSAPLGALIPIRRGTGTIIDDDASLVIGSASATEGNSGTRPAVFALSLTKPMNRLVTVNYATAPGTAAEGVDYRAASGSISFLPGEVQKFVTVLVEGDTLDEDDETFFVNLSSAQGVDAIAVPQGVGTIVDDDFLPLLSINSVSVLEPNSGSVDAVFIVNLLPVSGRTVTVGFSTIDVTATAGIDYVARSGVLTFAPGETEKRITVPVLGDLAGEVNEVFHLLLVAPANAGLQVERGIGTILDNDPVSLLLTGADAGGGPHVRAFDAVTNQERFSFFAYAPSYTGGVRVASADMNGDGQPDIITVPGAGGGPHVRLFDGRTGAPLGGPLGSFFAFEPAYGGGLSVAAADVTGDGRADLIVSTERSTGPARVRVFDGVTGGVVNNFNFPAAASGIGGVRVAAGDVNGDGRADVIVANAAGNTPRVVVLDARTGATLRDFFAYAPGFTGGVYVAAGDINGDGRSEIITGPGAGGGPHVMVFNGANGAVLHSFFGYIPEFRGGVRVGTVDADGNGRADILLGAGPGGGPHVRVLRGSNLASMQEFFAFTPEFRGGTFVGGANLISAGGSPQRAAAAASAGPLPGDALLTQEQLRPLVDEALARWAAAGMQSDRLARLRNVDVQVRDLAGDYLGLAFPNTIYIDVDAAGHGWFIDATPGADEEFADGVLGRRNRGRMDLLSTILHELGNAAGLEDLDPALHPDDVMTATLSAGVRRTPALRAVDAVFARGEWEE